MTRLDNIKQDIKNQLNDMIDSEMYSHEEIQEFREEMEEYVVDLQDHVERKI